MLYLAGLDLREGKTAFDLSYTLRLVVVVVLSIVVDDIKLKCPNWDIVEGGPAARSLSSRQISGKDMNFPRREFSLPATDRKRFHLMLVHITI